MRKHRTFKQEPVQSQEKKSKTGIYISIFLAVVMVGGVGGIMLGGDSGSDYSYGKFDFKSSNNNWITKINKKQVTFYLLPEQVSTMNVSKNALTEIKNSQGLIIAYNPEINSTSKLQVIDVFRLNLVEAITSSYSGKQVGYALTKKTESKLPFVTCENSSYYFPVMSIDYGNETGINLINTCIVVSATDEYSMLALLDNLRYYIYGVIE